jgi:hypothetical protein
MVKARDEGTAIKKAELNITDAEQQKRLIAQRRG